jgi:HIRAN domain
MHAAYDQDQAMPGLLNRFFRARTPLNEAARIGTVEATLYAGHETLEVVGESHYQEALWHIVGGRRPDPIRHETYAILVPDPSNRYDPNAIEVRIDGIVVGYLSREDAAAYRAGLLRLMQTSSNSLVALHAVVVGGGPRPDGIGYLGVFLDHDPADFGLAPHHTSNGHVRTGLSEAIATDLEDDSYDLSWYRELAEDDIVATRQLRSLLESERELISRHYMFCELEHRLYRCRISLPSALDEFDAICTQHHAEMDAIRPALLEKFGAVPVIEMYRQAVIRAQKAKQWEAAREWSERGIAIYGDSPARPEVVEDLRKRIAYAAAKIEAARRPRPQRPRRATVETVRQAPEVETLVCASCGATFERLRTRGRKPKTCPSCRGISSSAVTA